jgi:peptidoglycan/LPS O-acetylase OafA/YrhL
MPDPCRARERLDFLDAARGLAALFVLAEHGMAACVPGYLAWARDHVDLGQVGVVLFLLISGFIIPVSLEQGGSNARFWLRRCFRLFPAYWLSIVVGFGCYCCCDAICFPPLETGDWLLNLTMLQGFCNRPHLWGVFWTLQLELVIYGACSLLFTVGLLRRADWIAGLVLAGYLGIGLAQPLLLDKPFGINGRRFLYFAPLVGLVAQRCWAGQSWRGTLPALMLGQAFLLPAVWWVNHAWFPAAMTAACLRELAGTWGLAYACFFLLLATRRWQLPAACWLGRISYSVYLLHPFVLALVGLTDLPPWAFLPALLAGTLLVADLAYRFVEVPGIATGRALERRWWPAAGRTDPRRTVFRRAA